MVSALLEQLDDADARNVFAAELDTSVLAISWHIFEEPHNESNVEPVDIEPVEFIK